MNKIHKIDIGKDFSETPMGRYYPQDGNHCGQKFREDILVPALKEYDKVVVQIDDVEGYGSSFLEEAFGGLIRSEGFTKSHLDSKLEIVLEDPAFEVYRTLILKHIKTAKKA